MKQKWEKVNEVENFLNDVVIEKCVPVIVDGDIVSLIFEGGYTASNPDHDFYFKVEPVFNQLKFYKQPMPQMQTKYMVEYKNPGCTGTALFDDEDAAKQYAETFENAKIEQIEVCAND